MRVGKKALHFALLLFTAFWLVATSRPRRQALRCFSELEHPALVVTLGPRAPVTAAPSCQSIDELAEGSRLRVRVSRSGTTPMIDGNACWGYDVRELLGPRGTSNLTPAPLGTTLDMALFDAEGQLRIDGCTGDYRIRLVLDGPMREGKTFDALQPRKDEKWVIRRLVHLAPRQECSLLPELSNGYCQDDFEVRSVVYAP